MEDGPNEEDMDDVNLDDGRMVFDDNYGGVDDAKALLHSKRWYFYMNERGNSVKKFYSVEFFGRDGKKVIWGVVGNHAVGEATDHDEIGLRGFGFNFFDKDEKGVGREGSSYFPYLLMLIKLWTGDFS